MQQSASGSGTIIQRKPSAYIIADIRHRKTMLHCGGTAMLDILVHLLKRLACQYIIYALHVLFIS